MADADSQAHKSKKTVQFSKSKDEVFFDSKNAWTKSLDEIAPTVYRNPEERSVQCVAPPSTLSRPNYEGKPEIQFACFVIKIHSLCIVSTDLLRRVSIVIHQHINKCEHRLSVATPETRDTGLFHTSQMELFMEDAFITPKYAYHFVRAPLTRLGFLYGIRKLEPPYKIPELSEIYIFLRDLFIQASLSAECSVGMYSSSTFFDLVATPLLMNI